MEHPIIIKAFENAKLRGESIVYLTFKRKDLFYKDSYYNLVGTKEEVEEKIKKMYLDVEKEKLDCPRADGIEDLDTPFDSWCNETCIYKRMRTCDINTRVKCVSYWTHVEHTSLKELNDYVNTITRGEYPQFTVDYM